MNVNGNLSPLRGDPSPPSSLPGNDPAVQAEAPDHPSSFQDDLTNLNEQAEEAQASIERLDRTINRYKEVLNVRTRTFNTLIEFLGFKSARFLMLQTGEFLERTHDYRSKFNSSILPTVGTKLVFGAHVLGFCIQLFESCKSIVNWDRSNKMREALKDAPPLHVKQVLEREVHIKKELLDEVCLFLTQNIHFIKDRCEKNSPLARVIEEIIDFENTEKDLQKRNGQGEAQNKSILKYLKQGVAPKEKGAKILLQCLLDNSRQWQNIADSAQGDAHLNSYITALEEKKQLYENVHDTFVLIKQQSFIPAYFEEEIADRVLSTLKKVERIDRETLQRVLGETDLKNLQKDRVKQLLLEKGGKLIELPEQLTNHYLKNLLRYIDKDVENFRHIAQNAEAVKNALLKQQTAIEDGIYHIHCKIELILQAGTIKKKLERGELTHNVLGKLLPKVIENAPQENDLEKLLDTLFETYQTGFTLETVNSTPTGYNLGLEQERLEYLQEVLDIPLLESGEALTYINVIGSIKEQLEQSGNPVPDGDDELIVQNFAPGLARRAFEHKTSLEKTIKNGLQALAAQKIDAAKRLEEGGKYSKIGSLFVRGVYFFTTISTLVCLPLLFTGVLTIPAIVLLVASKSLHLIVSVSLVGGIYYWGKNAPRTFAEHISSIPNTLKGIWQNVTDLFRSEPLYPSENTLLRKKKDLLILEKQKLLNQILVIELRKQGIFALQNPNLTENEREKEILSLNERVELLDDKKEELRELINQTIISLNTMKEHLRERKKAEELFNMEGDEVPAEAINTMHQARIKDFAEQGTNLGNFHVEPVKLLFPSLFNAEPNNVSKKAHSLSHALTTLLLEDRLTTDMGILFETMGLDFDSIKVQIEEALYNASSQEKTLEEIETEKHNIRKRVQIEIEQALAQFFGGNLFKITKTETIYGAESVREFFAIMKQWLVK